MIKRLINKFGHCREMRKRDKSRRTLYGRGLSKRCHYLDNIRKSLKVAMFLQDKCIFALPRKVFFSFHLAQILQIKTSQRKFRTWARASANPNLRIHCGYSRFSRCFHDWLLENHKKESDLQSLELFQCRCIPSEAQHAVLPTKKFCLLIAEYQNLKVQSRRFQRFPHILKRSYEKLENF